MTECIICGNSFEQPKRRGGMLKKYCSEECRQVGVEKARQKYREKQKEQRAKKKKIPTKKVDESYIDLNTVIFEKKSVKDTELIWVSDILSITKELTDVLTRMRAMMADMCKAQSESDLNDQKFLHAVECMRKATAGEALKMFVELAENRDTRRDVKDPLSILQYLVNACPVNPYAYALKRIQGIKEKRDELIK